MKMYVNDNNLHKQSRMVIASSECVVTCLDLQNASAKVLRYHDYHTLVAMKQTPFFALSDHKAYFRNNETFLSAKSRPTGLRFCDASRWQTEVCLSSSGMDGIDPFGNVLVSNDLVPFL
jgi:hypothetical protein